MPGTYNTAGGPVTVTAQGAVFGGKPERQLGWVLINRPEGKITGEPLNGAAKVFDSLTQAVEYVGATA